MSDTKPEIINGEIILKISTKKPILRKFFRDGYARQENNSAGLPSWAVYDFSDNLLLSTGWDMSDLMFIESNDEYVVIVTSGEVICIYNRDHFFARGDSKIPIVTIRFPETLGVSQNTYSIVMFDNVFFINLYSNRQYILKYNYAGQLLEIFTKIPTGCSRQILKYGDDLILCECIDMKANEEGHQKRFTYWYFDNYIDDDGYRLYVRSKLDYNYRYPSGNKEFGVKQQHILVERKEGLLWPIIEHYGQVIYSCDNIVFLSQPEDGEIVIRRYSIPSHNGASELQLPPHN